MIIREATIDDAAKLIHCGKEFFAECNWDGMTWDFDNIVNSLMHILGNADFKTVLAETEEGLPAGFCIFGLERPWTKEFVAMMSMFYIRPEYRTGKIAGKVLDLSLNLCHNAGARMFFASSTAGFNDGGVNEKAFTALLMRRGFTSLGTFLFRGTLHV